MPYEIVGPRTRTQKATETNTGIEVEMISAVETERFNAADDGATEITAVETATSEGREPSVEHSAEHVSTAQKGVTGTATSSTFSRQESINHQHIDFKIVRAKCVVQLLLLNLVQDVVNTWYMKLSTQQVLKLVDGLWSSYEFAHKFNGSIEQRFALWRTGFMNQVKKYPPQNPPACRLFLTSLLHMPSKRCLTQFENATVLTR